MFLKTRPFFFLCLHSPLAAMATHLCQICTAYVVAVASDRLAHRRYKGQALQVPTWCRDSRQKDTDKSVKKRRKAAGKKSKTGRLLPPSFISFPFLRLSRKLMK